jgi:cytochrome c oxidase cbb3-type subunit 3
MSKAGRTDSIQGKIVHEYDGIEEADNELPRWWLAIFYLSTAFAIGYWFHYHEFGLGPSSREAYAVAEAEAEAKRPKLWEELSDEQMIAWANDPSLVAGGAQVFASTCAACHGDKGEGKIGPNLTDNFWMHGGDPRTIYKTVARGVVTKGMPAWEPMLGVEAVKQATAYVLSIRNTNLPGKAAEGAPPEGTAPEGAAGGAPAAEASGGTGGTGDAPGPK